jgi:hypothetical protein
MKFLFAVVALALIVSYSHIAKVNAVAPDEQGATSGSAPNPSGIFGFRNGAEESVN